jgi:hypothetical protein
MAVRSRVAVDQPIHAHQYARPARPIFQAVDPDIERFGPFDPHADKCSL